MVHEIDICKDISPFEVCQKLLKNTKKAGWIVSFDEEWVTVSNPGCYGDAVWMWNPYDGML